MLQDTIEPAWLLAFERVLRRCGVEPGDTVSLYLAPTSDSEAMAPASIPALLIDANGKQGAGGQQVVIVEPSRVGDLLRLVGRADLMITPGSRSPS